MIIEEYEAITYSDAVRRLSARFALSKNAPNSGLPDLTDIKSRRAFDFGDHWQNGDGFIGAMPTGVAATERIALLKRGFSPEDVISEVLDTHTQNTLGNEPQINLESEDLSEAELAATLEIVKEWFDTRDNLNVLSNGLRGARRESAHILRAFIPSGMIDGEGRIESANLAEALSKIWIRAENIESGGVVVDEATATELGLFQYRMRIGKSEVSLCEFAYLDAAGNTVWGTVSSHTARIGAEVGESMQLGASLPIYQINAPALITNSVCQAQRDLNLSGTMLTRNNNLAGSRERIALNVQKPGDWIEAGTNAAGEKEFEFQPAEIQTGAGVFNFLEATPIRDAEGNITGYGNPNVIFTDPVPIDTFLGTSQHWRSVIYSTAKMRHLDMADDATASGKSRIEARKEFQSSLNESKEIVDPAGKWMIEIALNIAAHFIGKPGKYLKTRATFAAEVSTIEILPEERRQIQSEYESGIIDLQTCLESLQYKNVAEIMERMENEKAERMKNEKSEKTGQPPII